MSSRGMLSTGAPLYGYVADGYWCDIGTLPEYHRANSDLLNGQLNLGDLGERIGPDIWAGGPVTIDAGRATLRTDLPRRRGQDQPRRRHPGSRGDPRLHDPGQPGARPAQHHLAQLLYRRGRDAARRGDRPAVQPEGAFDGFRGRGGGRRHGGRRRCDHPGRRQGLAEQGSRERRHGQPQPDLGIARAAGCCSAATASPAWSMST